MLRDTFSNSTGPRPRRKHPFFSWRGSYLPPPQSHSVNPTRSTGVPGVSDRAGHKLTRSPISPNQAQEEEIGSSYFEACRAKNAPNASNIQEGLMQLLLLLLVLLPSLYCLLVSLTSSEVHNASTALLRPFSASSFSNLGGRAAGR